MLSLKDFLQEDLSNPQEMVNKVVNRWVLTSVVERSSFNQFYWKKLLEFFPEISFEGVAYRSIMISPDKLDQFQSQVYHYRNKTSEDLQQAKQNSKHSDMETRMFADYILQYWNEIKRFAVLIPGGNSKYWKLIRDFINSKYTHRYVSWTETINALNEFERIIKTAEIPTQFSDFPKPEFIRISQKVNGLALYKLAHLVLDLSKSEELTKTKEIIALQNKDFNFIDQNNSDFLLPQEQVDLY